MSEETPQSEGEPSPATPEETPTAANKPFTYEDAVAKAGDEDDVAPAPPPSGAAPAAEAPTQAAPVAEPVTAATPVAATTSAPADRPAGIFVPKWLGVVAAAIVAALIFGGIGYAIGDSSDSGSTRNASSAFPGTGNGNGTQRLPGGGQFPGNGELPNGGQLPNGNGNGNGNGSGNGSDSQGGTTTSDAGFLGVGVQASTDSKGVEVTDVAQNSPAAKAGLQNGDVITALDGKDVTDPEAVRAAVQAKASGDQLSVTYTRDGQSKTVDVTLTSRSQAQSS
ncbi:MAG TPA: PDZ domain-containing protein [Acidimicrobiia bacterium]|jgi:membrane-associated protease RseP (regulator of RpoE activity)